MLDALGWLAWQAMLIVLSYLIGYRLIPDLCIWAFKKLRRRYDNG